MAFTTLIFYYLFFYSNSSLPFNSCPIPCFNYYYFSFNSRILTISSFLISVLCTLILQNFTISSSLISLILILFLILMLILILMLLPTLINLLPLTTLLILIIFTRFLTVVIIN